MPPKDKDKKDKKEKAKVNLAREFDTEGNIKKLLENLAKSKVVLDPINPFVKKLKAELVDIKEGEQFDPPSIPLFLTEPTPYECCRALFGALETYQWLNKIQLLHTKIRDDGAMVIAEFLSNYQTTPDRNAVGVELLELPGNDIGPRGAGFLGRMLTNNETITKLVLDFNPMLGDEGAGLLGDGLKWNSTVAELSLQYCSIGPEGGEMIAKYIVRSSSVKDLSIRGNPIGPHGATMIGRSLAKNAYLTSLDMADTSFGIDLEAIEALRDGIEGNEKLISVDLDLNSLVPAGVQLLVELVKAKENLIQFKIFERIGDAVFREFSEQVQINLKNSKKKKKGGKKGSPAASKPATADSATKPPPAAEVVAQ